MQDPVPYQDAGAAERDSPGGAPRWLKVTAIVALVIVLAVAVLVLTGGHDPGSRSH